MGHCKGEREVFSVSERHLLTQQGVDGKAHLFELDLQPSESGLNQYQIRMYPHHPLQAHHLDAGYLIWL
jgi:hypothetical protein